MPANESGCVEASIAEAIKNTVTPDDVALVSRRVLNDPSVEVLDYELGSYSADKLGFLGCHRQLKIKVKRKNEEEPEQLSLFVKSVPYECQQQASFVTEGVFAEEYNFFDKIAPHLLENYGEARWAPICYLAKSDSLIMEDLRCRGFGLRSSAFDGLAEIKAALTAVARLHACAILTEARLSRSAKRPVTLKEHYPDSFKEKVFVREGQCYQWVTAGRNLGYLIAEKSGLGDRAELRRGYARLFDLVKTSSRHRNVVCHGDLWTNNLMFDQSEPLPNCVLVDYQIVRYAPQVLDILQLLYLHSSRAFREQRETELIAFYHTVLADTVGKYKHDEDRVIMPSLNEVTLALDDLRLFGPALASLYFPLVLMDPEILREKTKDSQGYNEFIFGDRVDVTMDYFERNETFRNKVTEVVKELAEISRKL